MVDVIDGKPLCLGVRCEAVPAKHAERQFAGAHPVDGLLVLSAERDVHFAEEPPDKLRTQLWMIIDITQFACAKTRIARI